MYAFVILSFMILALTGMLLKLAHTPEAIECCNTI